MTNQPLPLDAERVSDERLTELIKAHPENATFQYDIDIASALRELQRLRAAQRESGGVSVPRDAAELARQSLIGLLPDDEDTYTKALAAACQIARALSASQRKECGE